jgi:hypothetical protein
MRLGYYSKRPCPIVAPHSLDEVGAPQPRLGLATTSQYEPKRRLLGHLGNRDNSRTASASGSAEQPRDFVEHSVRRMLILAA